MNSNREGRAPGARQQFKNNLESGEGGKRLEEAFYKISKMARLASLSRGNPKGSDKKEAEIKNQLWFTFN